MKNLVKTMLVFVIALTGLNANAQNEGRQNELVEKVLKDMVSGKTMSVSELISPAYLQVHDVKAGDYNVNVYYPKGSKLEKNHGNGLVTGLIWGEDKSWVHRLYFIVTYDGGNYYLLPGREPSEYGYIDPWYKVETNVEDQIGDNSGTGDSPDNSSAKRVVENLLDDMVNRSDEFGTDARKYIAPSFYKTERIDKYDYKINYYSPKGYEIVSTNGDKIVAHIWGEDKGWIHKLTFKVVKEGGKYYVYPKGHTDNNYIHPWYEVETNVEDKVTKTVQKDEKTELVEKLLDRMAYNKEGYETDMRLYIAPSYFKKHRLDPFEYKVNAYSPVGYSIESVDPSGKVVALIWGEDRGWVHELTFKVVKEDGLLYLMPGKHHESVSYVDPWYSARTDVE